MFEGERLGLVVGGRGSLALGESTLGRPVGALPARHEAILDHERERRVQRPQQPRALVESQPEAHGEEILARQLHLAGAQAPVLLRELIEYDQERSSHHSCAP